MRTTPSRMILGGDFNCVLSQTDCTGKGNYSRALQQLVRGYDLVDVWEAKPTRDMYTHYTRQGATRIDRLYITRNICESKLGVETMATAMTDHLAVVLRWYGRHQ
jgi:endonuclease/exonuclease/phosphatase family metal-dependent hydrolase